MGWHAFVSTQAVVDAWMDVIEAEYGSGWHTATLTQVAPVIADIIARPDQLAPSVVEFGYQVAQSNHALDFTMRCLELLATVGDPALSGRLDTRKVAVLVAEGWNSGTLGRLHPTDDQLTPMPVLLHLLRQRYLGARGPDGAAARRMVLVVVDLRDVATSRMELDRLRAATIEALRSVWSVASPISEGVNGKIVVMVDRDDELHARVARARRLILDASVPSARVHVWIEPLSNSALHLESHLVGLVGPIEMPPDLQRPDA